MDVVVGRVGRAHGTRGEVSVQVRTDDPDGRFAPGSVLATDPGEAGPLTVTAARWHAGRMLVLFEEVPDRTAAEGLAGTFLVVDTAADAPLEDPEEFYDHELVGLEAVTVAGAVLGAVDSVLHVPGQDLLAVRGPDGREVLVPFVARIVPTVDVPGGRLVVDPPPGLLEDGPAGST